MVQATGRLGRACKEPSMKRIATVFAVAAICATAPASFARPASHPAPKITMTQARAIALRAAPGKVRKAEYEQEGGGWRYSFDIIQGRRIHEIGVDAGTGRIVESKFESLKDKD
jgi:uncharacterized membrane protein YkoI